MQQPVQAEYDDAFSVTLVQTGDVAVITATPGYFGAGFTTWDVSIPDLTAIGFAPPLGLPAASTTWTVNATSYTGVSGIPSGNPVEGVTLLYATRSGTITP